jgi:hypothetical protein
MRVAFQSHVQLIDIQCNREAKSMQSKSKWNQRQATRPANLVCNPLQLSVVKLFHIGNRPLMKVLDGLSVRAGGARNRAESKG